MSNKYKYKYKQNHKLKNYWANITHKKYMKYWVIATLDNCGLQSVPSYYKTPEICLAAVLKSGDNFRWVPECHKTPALCMLAVAQHCDIFGHVPHELRTEELCMAAVSNCGDGLSDVPTELQTPEICMTAVAKSKSAAKFINDEQLKQTLMALYNIDEPWHNIN